ncbi:hypothetical protein HDV00_002147 [Rhizophlyctis rosea]|nr:hypothetical protein HDV00_002147 [Rhizophlyctis rosea]
MEQLPPELLMRILSYLNTPSLLNVSTASSTLNVLATASLWLHPPIPSYPPVPLEPLIKRHGHHIRTLTFPDPTAIDLITIAPYVPGLLRVDLSGCAPFSVGDDAVLAVLRSCPRLTGLILDDCIEMTDRCLVEGLAQHPNLGAMKELSIARCCEVTDVGIRSVMQYVGEGRTYPGPRSLSILNISCVPLLTELSLFAVAQVCPQLEELKAADSDAVTDKSLMDLARWCPLLKTLDVSECMMLTEKGLLDFENARKGIWRDAPTPIWQPIPIETSVGHLSSLKCNRTAPEAVTDKSLMALLPATDDHLAPPARWNRRPSFQSLELSFAGNVTADFFNHLSTNYAGQLTCLNLSGVVIRHVVSEVPVVAPAADASPNGVMPTTLESLTARDVKLLAEFLSTQPCLRHLNLAAATGLVTDETCRAIGARLHELETLDLSECQRVTDVGMVEVARGCRRLVDVNLKGCTELSDETVKAFVGVGEGGKGMAKGGDSKLRSLNLGLCHKITDVSVTLLADLCSRPGKGMHTLKLSGCLNITDKGLDYLYSCIQRNGHTLTPPSTSTTVITAHPHPPLDPLRLVCLSGCYHITTPALSRLASTLPYLESINFYSCPSITDAAVSVIAQNCSRLQSLVMSKCAISDVGFLAVSKGCPRLHTLYASFLVGRGPTDTGVRAVIENCRELKLLDVSRCEGVTDRAFSDGEGKGRDLALQILMVRVCGGVTFRGLCRVVERCPRLQRLDCTGCLRVGAEDRARLKVLVDERW